MSIKNPLLPDYADKLLLPQFFCMRDPDKTERVDALISLFDAKEHRRRRFLPGLFLAFICLAEELLVQSDVKSLHDVFDRYTPIDTVHGKGKANSLIIGNPPLSLRQYYNAVEEVIRHELQRPDYPNCAPHATQAWEQYRRQFSDICALSPQERFSLAQGIWERIRALPYIVADDGSVREIRPFEHIIKNFKSSVHEPAGAVLQGLVYAYYRADSPSVTFRPYKVGAGSSRVGAAGDVDGWVGNMLALSVEVKDLPIAVENLNQFDQFEMQLKRWPNCTALVVAQSFTPEAEEYLSSRQILAMTRETMTRNVSFWDVPKQKLAVRELHYYFGVIQRNTKLTERFESFCMAAGIKLKE